MTRTSHVMNWSEQSHAYHRAEEYCCSLICLAARRRTLRRCVWARAALKLLPELTCRGYSNLVSKFLKSRWRKSPNGFVTLAKKAFISPVSCSPRQQRQTKTCPLARRGSAQPERV